MNYTIDRYTSLFLPRRGTKMCVHEYSPHLIRISKPKPAPLVKSLGNGRGEYPHISLVCSPQKTQTLISIIPLHRLPSGLPLSFSNAIEDLNHTFAKLSACQIMCVPLLCRHFLSIRLPCRCRCGSLLAGQQARGC